MTFPDEGSGMKRDSEVLLMRRETVRLNAQLRQPQSLEAEIKRRDAKDLDEVARAEHIAGAAARVKRAIATLGPATKGPPSRGLFG